MLFKCFYFFFFFKQKTAYEFRLSLVGSEMCIETEKAGRKRGFLISGGEVDTERMSRILLDEFRGGKLGRFTLEFPPEGERT